jgi:peptidyl-Asp metalloendopeptidase
VLALSGSRGADDPEPRVLLRLTDVANTDLSEKQARVLDRIRHAPNTVSVSVTKLEAGLPDSADVPLELQLNPNVTVRMKGYRVTKDKDATHLSWKKKDKPEEQCILSIRGNSATGLFYSGGKVYSVEPLGNGLQAVTEVDQRKPKEDPEGSAKEAKHVRKKKARKADTSDEPRMATADDPAIIRVLIAYTPKVDDLEADVQDLIDSAIQLANTSYENSEVYLRLELAHTVMVDYTESDAQATDLDRFQGTDDGYMDEIHQLRQDHEADICVLLIHSPEATGKAATIGADKDSAFAVVADDYAAKNLTLAHEIGHLLGARHNPEVDPTEDPDYPWNHGYLGPDVDWCTVMAYTDDDHPNRVLQWSNPNVSLGGVPTGTEEHHNNAHMLNIWAPIASSFHR